MYSLLWLLATALAWLTLRLGRGGLGPGRALAWVGAAAGGSLHPLLLPLRVARLRRLAAASHPRAGRARWSGAGWRPSPRSPSSLVPAGSREPSPMAGDRQLAGAAAPLARRSPVPVSSSPGACWPAAATGAARTGWTASLRAHVREPRTVSRTRGRPSQRFDCRPTARLALGLAAVLLGPYLFDPVRHTGASRIPATSSPRFPAAMLLVALAVDRFRAARALAASSA